MIGVPAGHPLTIPELKGLLRAHLLPKLRLADVMSLAGTCSAFRQLIGYDLSRAGQGCRL